MMKNQRNNNKQLYTPLYFPNKKRFIIWYSREDNNFNEYDGETYTKVDSREVPFLRDIIELRDKYFPYMNNSVVSSWFMTMYTKHIIGRIKPNRKKIIDDSKIFYFGFGLGFTQEKNLISNNITYIINTPDR